MKHLDILRLGAVNAAPDIAAISSAIRLHPAHNLEFTPWDQFSYKPQVSFHIAYTEEYLALHFDVCEESLRLAHNKINSNVYEDNCVEFFIAVGDDREYYNFEFNAAGVCLAGIGAERTGRTEISEKLLSTIRYSGKIVVAGPPQKVIWELTLAMPWKVFSAHKLEGAPLERCRINVYKCGDALATPHFVAWNNIESAEPNFHLPAFFGTADFR